MILRLLGLIQKNLEAMTRLDEEFHRDETNREPEEQHEQSQAWSIVDGEPMIENKHLQGSFFGISGALERLTRLSVLISKASQNNRSARVEAFREKRKMDFAGFEDLTNLIIKNKYPMISDSLKLQLTRSIVYRRQSIVYHQHREAKYRRERTKNETVAQNNTPGESRLGTRSIKPAQAAAPNHQEKSNFTGFTPLDGSEFNRQHVALGQSKTESTASVGAADVCYPRPPRPKDEAAGYIDCRYCSKKVEPRIFGSPVLWRKHIDDDLKPFLCLSEQCAYPAVGFSKYSSWRKHMEEEHGANWIQYSHNLHPLKSKDNQAPGHESAICPFCQTLGDRLEDEKPKTEDKHEASHSAQGSAPEGNSRKDSGRQVHFQDESPAENHEEQLYLIDKPGTTLSGSDVAHKMLTRHIAAHLQTLCFQTLEAGLADGDIDGNSEHGSESLRTATASSGGFVRNSNLSSVSLPFDGDSDHSTPVIATPDAFGRLCVVNLKSDTPNLFVGDWLRNLEGVSVSSAEGSSRLNYREEDHGASQEPPAEDIRQYSPETHVPGLEDPAILTEKTLEPELIPMLSSSGSEKDEDFWDSVDNRLVSVSTGRQFLPLDDLESLISVPNVRRALKSLNRFSDLEVDKHVNDVCNTTLFGHRYQTSRKKTFAILVMIDNMEALPSFISENIYDVHLPLELKREDGNRKGFLYYKPTLTGVSVRFEGSCSWKTSKIWDFNNKQWRVVSPFFDMQLDKPHLYCFDVQTILSFIEEYKEQDAHARGSRSVFRVKIHPAHHNYPQPTGSQFIIEEWYYNDQSALARELQALKALGRQDQKHLLRLLAAYEMPFGCCNFLYLCSDGNLQDLWGRFPEPKSDHSLISWFAEQAAGIASSLDFVLNQPWNVGVVKQDLNYVRGVQVTSNNVLWFRDREKDESVALGGILQIRDFDAELDGASVTYRGPEYDVAEKTSQPFEIWHLGCLLLEFVSWFLEGQKGLRSFADARLDDERVDELIPSDKFFTISVDHGIKIADLKPSVRSWIQGLHRHPECSSFLHHMLDYILHRPLCIKPEERDKSAEVVRRLAEMAEHCNKDSVYACQGCPKPANKTEPVLTDNEASRTKDDQLLSHAISHRSVTREGDSMELHEVPDAGSRLDATGRLTEVLELGKKGDEPFTTGTSSHSKGRGAMKRGLDSSPSAAASDTEMSSSGFVSPPSLQADVKRRKTQPGEDL